MVRGGAGERLPVSIRTRPPPADPTSITTWTDALDQLKNPKPRDPVPGIFYKAQYCEEILDMSSIEEFEPAEFDEGDVAAAELDFEEGAVMAGAKEHGLLFQWHAVLTVGEHAGVKR